MGRGPFAHLLLGGLLTLGGNGSIRISMGALVSSPPTSLWWSIMPWMSASLILAGNSAGLFVSTITTGVSATRSEMISGLSSDQRSRTKSASVLGSPKSTATASVPV